MVPWLLISTLLAAVPNAPANDENDPFIWLEEVDGERALEWVRQQNAASGTILEGDPRYQQFLDRSLEILNSRERIEMPSLGGGMIYNFWQDATHVRGIWRRTEVAAYLAGTPQWETVLDVDELARIEGENWVYKGSSCLYPEERLCLVNLSRGGGDAVVVREFDTAAKSFVPGGFTLAEAKSRVGWRDQDSIWVGTDFGPGTLTDSGYPLSVRLWKRGTRLEDAPVIHQGGPQDVASGAYSMHTEEGRYDFAYTTPAFFRGLYWLILDGRKVKLDLPEDVNLRGIFKQRLLFSLRSNWTVAGRTWPQGALLAIDVDGFLAGVRDFEMLFEPTERTSLASVSMSQEYLIIRTLENVRSRLYLMTPGAGSWTRTPVDLPQFGSVGMVIADSTTPLWFYTYSDFLQPSTLYAVESGRSRKLRQLPEFFSTEGLEVQQMEAVSADGERIPYFLVARKGIKLDGSHPTLLYGYGGFEIAQTPNYSAVLGAAWLEKGGVYAVANIRGGGEFGARWHQAALLKNRHRAFQDFIAVGEDLVRRGYTSPRRLGIQGGSNGGLLVGAVVTMRPDLFGAVVCQVPLLDMKRYHRLLAGASWMAEYGNPDDPDMWDYIRTYSPYQNVKPDTRYPRVLFMTSTRDDRVHPGHARKMVARMLDLGHPVYYYENMEGGHAGAANNRQRAHMSALAYTYLWKELSDPGN